ncbi:MAG: efflux RND transporter periplasmic adaptor subunit [Verrucomicrobiota bacterium]
MVKKAEQRDITLYTEYTGTTVASETAEIKTRVSGYIEKILFEPSTEIKKNQPLFLIEPEPYRVARDRALAQLDSAKANLRSIDSELKRLEEALESDAVSKLEVTQTIAERDQGIAAITQAKADLRKAEIDLSYTEIKSPIEGLIGRNFVDVGNLVGTEGSTLLATVVKIDPIYAYFDVNERTISKVLQRLGSIYPDKRKEKGHEVQAGALLFVEGREEPFEGYADYIDNQIDIDTGTIQVRAAFPNPKGLLLPGFFARVRLPGEKINNALLVEEIALSTDLGGRFLYLVGEDNLVEKRYVELGPLQDNGKRIILKGITDTDTFISKGIQKARPGLPVTPNFAGQGSTPNK